MFPLTSKSLYIIIQDLISIGKVLSRFKEKQPLEQGLKSETLFVPVF